MTFIGDIRRTINRQDFIHQVVGKPLAFNRRGINLATTPKVGVRTIRGKVRCQKIETKRLLPHKIAWAGQLS